MAQHFDITQWSDFVRDLVTGTARDEMATHLARCGQCRELMTWQARIRDVASRDAAYEPPESVVRLARAIFPHAPSPLVSLPSLLAQLAGGSLLEPQLAGVRSTARRTRQGLFEAGNFSVDVRVEQDASVRRVAVVGQLQDHRTDAPALANLPVLLVDGDRVIDQTTSNEFGEFQFECEPRRRLSVHVAVDNATRRLEVPLEAFFGMEGSSR